MSLPRSRKPPSKSEVNKCSLKSHNLNSEFCMGFMRTSKKENLPISELIFTVLSMEFGKNRNPFSVKCYSPGGLGIKYN